MTSFLQLNNNHGVDGQVGDCFRTSVGCILNLPPEDVPHFMDYNWEEDKVPAKWYTDLQEWLMSKGYSYLEFHIEQPEDWFKGILVPKQKIYHLLSGTSRKGYRHTIVGVNGLPYHDPGYPGISPALSPYEEDRMYGVGIITFGMKDQS